MNRRLLLNVGLAALVAVLGALVYLRPGTHHKKAPRHAITHLSPRQVKTLRVRYGDHPQVKLARQGSGWQITQPWHARASDSLVSSVLADIDEKAKAVYPVSSLKLAKFGLASPGLRLWLNGTEVDFGSTSPLDGARYIRVGKRVFVVDDNLYGQLAVKPSDYVSTRLVPAGATITRIALPGRTLVRDSEGKWRARPRPGDLADGAIRTLVDSWTNAYAQSARPAGNRAGRKVTGRVTVHLQGRKTPLSFTILASAGSHDLLLARNGWVYRLSSERRQDLLHLKHGRGKTGADGAREATRGSAKSPSGN